MKNLNYFLLFIFLLAANIIQAQEDQKKSKFNLIAFGGIGYGIVENNNQPNYNLNNNGGEFLINYNINKKFGLATGVGLNAMSGNGFNSIGNFYHQRNSLKVPVLFTINPNLSNGFKFYANLGVYGQTIIKDEYRFIDKTQENVYEGWNYGAQVGLGFMYEIFDCYYAGLHYLGQSDFNKLESNSNSGVNNKQKIKSLNTIGVVILIEL